MTKLTQLLQWNTNSDHKSPITVAPVVKPQPVSPVTNNQSETQLARQVVGP